MWNQKKIMGVTGFMTQDKEITINNDLNPNTEITFLIDNEERIKICEDGTFLVNGKKVEKDIELYHAFVNFFKSQGFYKE